MPRELGTLRGFFYHRPMVLCDVNPYLWQFYKTAWQSRRNYYQSQSICMAALAFGEEPTGEVAISHHLASL